MVLSVLGDQADWANSHWINMVLTLLLARLFLGDAETDMDADTDTDIHTCTDMNRDRDRDV